MKRLVFFGSTVIALLLVITAAQGQNGRHIKRNVERVDKMSGELKGDLDHALDKSRLDGRPREDRINELANEFHSAASKFKDKFDDGHWDRAEGEARETLRLGWQLDEAMGRANLGGRVAEEWSQIKDDLNVIQDAYGVHDDRNPR